MRDYDGNRPEERPDGAPKKTRPAKPAGTGPAETAPQTALSTAKPEAVQSEPSGILQHEHRSHPANAGQLAGILTELQQSHGNAYVQQVVSGMNEPGPEVKAPLTSGQTLDDGVKTEMESAFGESFGEVRVHTGDEARQMNEGLGARAVTRGRDIYFDSGEYNPATQEGKELLAHELAHTIQQKGEAKSNARSSVGQPGDSFEQEADRAASAVLRGERPLISQRGAAPLSYQRQQPRPHSPQRDAGADAGVGDYVRRVDLPPQESAARLGPHARYIYSHNPLGDNYTLFVFITRPLQFNSMLSTIDSTFESLMINEGEMLTFHVTARRGSQIYLQVRFTHGRRNIDIRFNFPIRPRRQ